MREYYDDFESAPNKLLKEWTDEERMEGFVATGDFSYLTVEQKKFIEEVTGVTEENINYPEYSSQEEQDFLSQFGVSKNDLEQLSTEDKFKRLLQIAGSSIDAWPEADFEEFDEVRERIILILQEQLLKDPESLRVLFLSSVRFYEAAGVRDVEVVHEVYRNVYREFIRLSHTYESELNEDEEMRGHQSAALLNEFVAAAHESFLHQQADTPVDPRVNYLAFRYFESFANRIGLSEDAHLDHDDFLPFEIEQGKLALFSVDKKDVFILDKSDSDNFLEKNSDLLQNIAYLEAGHYFARHQQVAVPEALWWEFDSFYDVGSSVSFIGFSAEQLRDYVSLLRSDARLVIERDFDVRLSELTIKEQLYFLNYLQNTNLAEAESMQEFTHFHEVEGMRTFLALERGEESLGDQIVAFGTHEKAKEVFAYYSGLLDGADRAERLVRETLKNKDAGENEIEEQVQHVRDKILNASHDVLINAVSGSEDDLEKVLNQMKQANLKTAGVGVTYSELLNSGAVNGIEDLESLSSKTYSGPEVLSNEALFESIKKLYRQRYSEDEAEVHIINLQSKLDETESEMTIMQFDDEVLASILVVPGQETTYIGALNTTADKETNKIPIGRYFIDTVVEARAASGETLEATATLENAIAYINIYKFRATALLTPSKQGDLRLKLLRNDEWPKQSKELKKSQIIGVDQELPEGVNVVKLEKENPQLDTIPEGSVITRIERDRNFFYLVLEKSSV